MATSIKQRTDSKLIPLIIITRKKPLYSSKKTAVPLLPLPPNESIRIIQLRTNNHYYCYYLLPLLLVVLLLPSLPERPPRKRCYHNQPTNLNSCLFLPSSFLSLSSFPLSTFSSLSFSLLLV